MTLLSRAFARLYKFPPAETYDVAVDKALEMPMRDGVVLRADRYYPRNGHEVPTLLMRTPYGRAGAGSTAGQLFAERGFQVVVQSCRGTDDSGGERTPFRGERADGLDTLEWLKQQSWFDGRLGMAGMSYLGFTQWAVARDAGPILKALATQATSSEFRSVTYPGESFNLGLWLQWIQITNSLGSMLRSRWDMVNAGRRFRRAAWHLPLREADEALVGRRVQVWRDWLAHTEPGDPWWEAEDYSSTVGEVAAPNHMLSGWYDVFLPQVLRDYASLVSAGRSPYLTIGPWSHSSNGLQEAGLRESYHWLRAHLLGDTSGLRSAPVRIYITGAEEWRDLPIWPPPPAEPQRWQLQSEGALGLEVPSPSPPSRFRYDPADPTPNIGGAINATLGRGTGPQDNRKLEARSDVLIFTSRPLESDIEVVGPVSAELYVASSLEHTDFFVRVCDVHPTRESMNICDGLLRLSPGRPAPMPDGTLKIRLPLWPTAHCFRKGHRIRVQASSGAFPRYTRNLGTGEPLATGTTMRVAEQQVYHDPEHCSTVVLPVLR